MNTILTEVARNQPTKMTTVPRIIHQVWLGQGAPPPEQVAWNAGLRALHPDWEYRLWTDSTIEQLGIEHPIWECRGLSSVSNVVRLYALLRFGGVYLDFDVEGLRPLDDLMNCPAFAAYDGAFYQWGHYATGEPIVCNAVMAAVPGHRWIQDQIAGLSHTIAQDPPWGPKLATICLGEDVTLYPTRFFYPFSWEEKEGAPAPDSYLAHHWSGL